MEIWMDGVKPGIFRSIRRKAEEHMGQGRISTLSEFLQKLLGSQEQGQNCCSPRCSKGRSTGRGRVWRGDQGRADISGVH